MKFGEQPWRRNVQIVGEMSQVKCAIGEMSCRQNDQTVGELSNRQSVHNSIHAGHRNTDQSAAELLVINDRFFIRFYGVLQYY